MENNEHFDTGKELFFVFDLEFDLCHKRRVSLNFDERRLG